MFTIIITAPMPLFLEAEALTDLVIGEKTPEKEEFGDCYSLFVFFKKTNFHHFKRVF